MAMPTTKARRALGTVRMVRMGNVYHCEGERGAEWLVRDSRWKCRIHEDLRDAGPAVTRVRCLPMERWFYFIPMAGRKCHRQR